jgi:hypothetical protein
VTTSQSDGGSDSSGPDRYDTVHSFEEADVLLTSRFRRYAREHPDGVYWAAWTYPDSADGHRVYRFLLWDGEKMHERRGRGWFNGAFWWLARTLARRIRSISELRTEIR